jgi:PAS domain S-box-containing protein
MRHRLLRRQLKKIGLDEQQPPSSAEWQQVLERIDRSYQEADQDRYLLERSLAISSQEMQELYDNLKETSETRISTERDRLKAVMENAIDGIMTFDAQGYIRSFNPAAERIFGYSAEEFNGQKIWMLLDGSDQGHIVEEVNAEVALEKLLNGNAQSLGLHKDGRPFHLDLMVSEMMLGGERMFIGIARDVTKRVEAEEALKDSEEKYRVLIENANEAVVVAVSGVFGFVNPKAVEITGYPRKELLGKPFIELIHPDDRSMVAERHQKRVQGEELPNVYSFRIISKQGDVKWLEINAVFIYWEGKPATLNLLSDVTERVLAEQELRQMKEFNESIVRSMGEGLIMENSDGNFTFANPAAEKLLDYSPGELSGKHWTDIVPPDQQTIVERANKRRVRGEVDRYEIQLAQKNGNQIVVLVNGAPRYEDGQYVGSMATFTDITERAQAEEKVRQHAEDLSLLNSLNEAINQGEDLEKILSLLGEQCKVIFSSNGASVYLLDSDKQNLILQNLNLPANMKKQIEKLVGMEIPALKLPVDSVRIYREVLRKNQSTLITGSHNIQSLLTDLAGGAELPGESWRKLILKVIPQIHRKLKIDSMMIVPLGSEQAPIGLLETSRKELFTEADLERFEAIARQMTATINRKRAQDALGESEERYRVLFENTPIGLGVTDENGSLIDFNSAMLEPGGYGREELKQFNFWDDFYYDPQEKTEVLVKTEQQGFLHREEVRLKPKQGSFYDALLSLTPINIDGKRYWQAMIEDITERKRAEEQLRLQSAALTSAANAILIIDKEGLIMWVNSAYTGMTGYKAEEVIGRPAPILSEGTLDQKLSQEINQNLHVGKVWRGEVANQHKDRSEYIADVTVTPVLSADGQVNHFIAIQQDISDRKRAEEEIRRRNRELALLNQVIAAASTSLEPDAVLQTTCRELAIALNVPLASAAILDEDKQTLEIVAEYKPKGYYSTLGAIFPLEANPLAQYVVNQKEPLAINDRQYDPLLAPAFEQMRQRGSASLLILPLILWGQVLGTIGLDSFEEREFTEDEINLAATAASAAAQVIETARLFKETQRRAEELETLVGVSAAMRSATTRSEMLPIILNELLYLLQADGVALALRDPVGGETVIELARGAWAKRTGERLPPGKGIFGQVIDTGQHYLNNQLQDDPGIVSMDQVGMLSAVVCVPMIAQENTIGALLIGRQVPIMENELRLVNAISDLAANAIHRASLHEQTERRLQRLGALRMIDEAISASLDLRITLTVFLRQVTTQLQVDAAAVLLLDPHLQRLTHEAGYGFRTEAITHSHLRLGEGYAGKAALERQVIHIPNLAQANPHFERAQLLSEESFVAYYAVPLVAKGQVKGVLDIYHRTGLEPDPDWLDFLETLATQAAIAVDNAILFDDLQRSNVELALAYDTTIEGWARALELRDMETQGHSQRVTEMTLELARMMGMSGDELTHVRHGSLLHDIGKMGVPDSILHKAGPLNEEQWAIMHKHPIYAYELLSPISYLRSALDIPYCHHEKWDGTGYPRGLEGDKIPLAARIFAVVDVWDALCSDRPYRAAWSQMDALKYIKDQAGKHFDPRIVDAFLSLTKSEQ